MNKDKRTKEQIIKDIYLKLESMRRQQRLYIN